MGLESCFLRALDMGSQYYSSDVLGISICHAITRNENNQKETTLPWALTAVAGFSALFSLLPFLVPMGHCDGWSVCRGKKEQGTGTLIMEEVCS